MAKELGCKTTEILDWELNLFDVQPATMGGLGESPEFLYSARLDNLATVFVTTEALVQYVAGPEFNDSPDVSVAVFFRQTGKQHRSVNVVRIHRWDTGKTFISVEGATS